MVLLTCISILLRSLPMTPLEFMKTRGESETAAVATRAGTTLAYFKQIAYQYRRPSPELAKRLHDASGGVMDAAELTFMHRKRPRAT